MKRAGGSDVARATVPDMSRTPRRIAGRLIKVVAAIAVVLGVASLPSSAAEDPNYPGLPQQPSGTGWNGPKATGISQAAAAKQWLRLPPLFTVAAVPFPVTRTLNCNRGDFKDERTWTAQLFYISTDDRAPEPYGYIGPFKARTVAFGSIPAEAEVMISQPRDEENLPIGIPFKQVHKTYCAGKEPDPAPTNGQAAHDYGPVDITTTVDITITALAVDGVDLDLGEGCRPTEQSVMKLGAPGYYEFDPDVDIPTTENRFTTTRHFNVGPGGLLTGTVDIGAFSGCTTASGEDVSALLTATVSGDGNRVEVRSEGLQVGSLACAEDRTKCTNPAPGLPFPEGGQA